MNMNPKEYSEYVKKIAFCMEVVYNKKDKGK